MGPKFLNYMMHPKTEIKPSREAIQKILKAGWWGQIKIHGHRAQIHIPASADELVYAFNRHGKLHKKDLPLKIAKDLRRVFAPSDDWTVIDCEWLKPKDQIYVFDILKLNGKLLTASTYEERWDMIPRLYQSEFIKTLPILKTFEKCREILDSPEDHVEGLVFKSASSPGFKDTSIVRCRINRPN